MHLFDDIFPVIRVEGRLLTWYTKNCLSDCMPRSPVFQKGQSLAEFTDRYGSEEQCRAALFQARWPQGFECPECGRKRCCRLRCRNVFQCTRCRHQVSLTASTVFANTKLPLIEMVSRHVSADPVEERSLGDGPGASVGSQLQHGLVAEAQADAGDEGTGRERPAGPHREVDDPTWGAKPEEANADEGAEGKTPFVAAVQVTEEGRPVALRMSCVKGFRKQEIAAWAHRHLRRETVVSDGLACFRGVEEAGL